MVLAVLPDICGIDLRAGRKLDRLAGAPARRRQPECGCSHPAGQERAQVQAPVRRGCSADDDGRDADPPLHGEQHALAALDMQDVFAESSDRVAEAILARRPLGRVGEGEASGFHRDGCCGVDRGLRRVARARRHRPELDHRRTHECDDVRRSSVAPRAPGCCAPDQRCCWWRRCSRDGRSCDGAAERRVRGDPLRGCAACRGVVERRRCATSSREGT